MEVQNEIKNNADDTRDVIVSVEHLKTYFNAGKFLMIGTCPDVSGESLIIAHGTREELEEAVQFDSYYADQLATYEIREYKVDLFNEAIKNYID